MDNQQSKTATKPQLSPYQEGVKKALKQAGEQQTFEAMQQGVPPQHIEQQAGLSQQQLLDQLLTLSKTQVTAKAPSDGGLMSGRVGLIGALLNAAQGQGFNPMAQKTESLGFDNAAQLMGLQQTANKNAMDARKFPLEMQQLAGNQAVQEQTYNQNAVMNPLQVEKTQAEIEAAKPENKLAMKREEQKIKSGNIDLAQNATETMKNLFDIREKIFFKGPLGNVLGAPAKRLGIGTEGRAEWDSTVNQFVFDVGALLEQKGKAFTGEEQKIVKNQVLKAGLSETKGAFVGSMRAVARRINDKAGDELITIDKKGNIVTKEENSKPLKAGSSGTALGIKYTVS